MSATNSNLINLIIRKEEIDMSNKMNNFDKRLQYVFTVSGVTRKELADRLGVTVPVVSRWLNGVSVPDINQFREIARFFGMPYEWFLDDGNCFPSTDGLAQKLGLTKATVEAMMCMTDSEDAAVMSAVEEAIWAVLSAVITVYENLERRESGTEDAE